MVLSTSTGCYSGLDGAIGQEVERHRISALDLSTSQIRFSANDENIELILEPNTDLLAADAVVIREGERLLAREAGLRLPFRGSVYGDHDSWIRVTVSADAFEGLIFTDDDLWEIRTDSDGDTWMIPASSGDYIDHPSGAHHACATTRQDADFAIYSDLGGAQFVTGCTQIDIALVADHTYVAKLGSSSAAENEMLSRLNEVDGIFRSDLNAGFSVHEVMTFASPGSPSFNSSSSGATPLNQFGSWKQSELPERGLAHLFVARTSSGTVGQAYVGSTCSPRYGSGVSNYLGSGKSSTVIVAHEIGHNFGANHDPSGSPYIMAPSVYSQANDFSNQSESQINSHLAASSCFVPCETAEPPPEPLPSPEPEPEPQPTPDPASCVDSCGGRAPAGCWCDRYCSYYGDCCSDYGPAC